MNRVTILTTDSGVASCNDFELNDTLFAFHPLRAEAQQMLIEGPVWAFVDWLAPDISGLEMCRRLRADPRTRDAHITLVLERDDPEDRRRALRAGADDYLVGPVDRRMMLDRILALDPAAGWRGFSQVIRVGELQIDIAAEQVRWRDTLVTLRPKEFRVLRFMAENSNRILTRRELVDALGKSGDPNYERTVDVWLKRLRAALREAGAGQLLRTVRNKGYVFDVL